MAQALVALVEALAAVVDRHMAAEVAQVTHGVDAQVGARREPQVAVAPARERVEADRCKLASLAHARPIAEEEAAARRPPPAGEPAAAAVAVGGAGSTCR